jgi:multiple sugar transport system substrate-binding protein
MKPPNRRSLIVTAPLALALIAAGCGSDSSGGAGGVCDGEIAESELTMFAHEGSEADAYRAAIDDFNTTRGAEIGVTVDLTLIPEGQYTDQINAAAAAGDLPDVIDFDGPNMANLAWGGHLVSIESCISDELRDNVLPSLIAQGTYADVLYSVGSFDSGLGLWAWRSALEEADARIPSGPEDAWTVEEFEQVLSDLQDAGYEHPLDTKFWYGSQGEWFSYAFTPVLWSAGGGLIDRTDYASADGALNSEASAASLTTFQSWVDDGLIDKDAADDSNFLEKQSPISWVGHWMYGAYKEAAGDDLVLLPLPDFGTGSKTGMGSWAWGITSAAADGDAAWAVIDYLMSDEAILSITEVNGAIPGTSSAIGQSPNHAEGGDLELYVTQLQGAPDIAVPRPVTPAYPNMTQVFRRVVDDIVNGADVQATLDAAVQSIDSDIDANEGYPAPGS